MLLLLIMQTSNENYVKTISPSYAACYKAVPDGARKVQNSELHLFPIHSSQAEDVARFVVKLRDSNEFGY